LLVPSVWVIDADTDVLRVWGYSDRDALTDDADVLDADLNGEVIVRAYAKHRGFQNLLNDRALFQQWVTQSNNTDVSPTQLLGMYQVTDATWRDLRVRSRLMRRVG
jgi:hypothetical protein